jgi:hypothetical protein
MCFKWRVKPKVKGIIRRRVLACVNLPLVMPLNEGLIEHKELLKIFNK